MRLFLAVPLSEGIKAALSDYQDALRASGTEGNFSPTENLHITLAFIGEYGDPEDVIDAAAGVSFRSFDLEIRDTGMFSDTLWVGVAENADLQKLVKKLRRALSDSGIPFDRKKFRPHITLVRRVSLPGRLSSLPQMSPSSMTVGSFLLFRSDRGKHGMIYTELACFNARNDNELTDTQEEPSC